MRAAGFEPLVFEDAQDLLLDQLNGINGARFQCTLPNNQGLLHTKRTAGSALVKGVASV